MNPGSLYQHLRPNFISVAIESTEVCSSFSATTFHSRMFPFPLTRNDMSQDVVKSRRRINRAIVLIRLTVIGYQMLKL
jgi:hypothetical protein